MGFFSQDCRGCGHAVISPYAASPKNAWMAQAVVLTPRGSLIRGEHDGYGDVDGREYAIGETNEVWHAACHTVAGAPTVFTAESRRSHDQGYFFDGTDYDFDPPRNAADLAERHRIADARAAEDARAWREALAESAARRAAAGQDA